MRLSGRGLLRAITRTGIVVLIIVNGLLYLDTSEAKREAVSGLLPQSAVSVQPEVLLDWSGFYPKTRLIEQSDITQEFYGVDGRVGYGLAAFNPNNQSIVRSSMFEEISENDQLSTLRHEYGHALLSDLLVRDRGGDYYRSRKANALQELTQGDNPSELPELLLPIFEDYRSAPRSIYDRGMESTRTIPGYFTREFGEFFAESFARYLEGEPIPAATRAVFERIEALQD